MNRALLLGAAALVVAAAIAVPLAVTNNSPATVMAPQPHKFISPKLGVEALVGSPIPPDSGDPNMNCGPDMTNAIETFLTTLPPGTTSVTFPANACYTVVHGIVLQNVHNLTINGNGATFNAWPPAGGRRPAMAVTSNTITLATAVGISIGMNVTGTNLPTTGTLATVTAVNLTTNVVTLSNVTPGPLVTGTTCTPSSATGCYTFACNTGTCDSSVPILFLAADSNITIQNLNLQGGWDGSPFMNGICQCGHGVNYESRIGVLLQGNTNVIFTGCTIQGTQGDGFSVQLPTGTGGGFLPGVPVNRNITLANSTLNNIGYTLTVEAVIGLTITGVSLNNYQQIDFEVDDAGSGFTSPSSDPVFAAQDNIAITNSHFSNFNAFWWTSLQGFVVPTPAITHTSVGFSTTTLTMGSVGGIAKGNLVTGPGIATTATVKSVNTTTKVVTLTAPASPGPLQTGQVYTFSLPGCVSGAVQCLPPGCVGTQCTGYYATQQVNVTFSGNTIDCTSTPTCALIQVSGLQSGLIPNRWLNIGLTIKGNTLMGQVKSTSGGSLCTADAGNMMTFEDVNQVTVENNIFPANTALGCPPPHNLGPFAYLGALSGRRVDGLVVKNNQFPGTSSVINPVPNNNTNVVECGNTYGLNGSMNDGSC